MKIWRNILVLVAVIAMAPACIDGFEIAKIDENPDDAVIITYLGKGFLNNNTVYGDLFQIDAEEGMLYDYKVVPKSALRSKYTPSGEEPVSGSGTYACGILPEESYAFVVLEMNPKEGSIGRRYAKEFEPTSYISYGVDGKLSPQAGWKAEYLGRYEDKDAAGNTIKCDRISTSGTGDALYYHVICPAGFIKTSEDLLEAFRKGAGADDLRGGEGLIEWYKTIAPSYNYLIGLDGLLARGGKDSDSGFMDYTLGTSSTGTFDVYTVEMLLNGHITGRYGKTTLEINGKATVSGALRRAHIKK